MKLSSKDILLVFGIIVAIVVTLTTIAYSSEQSSYVPKVEVPARKAELDQKAGDFLRKSLKRVRAHYDNGQD
jgi:hypothetical protein